MKGFTMNIVVLAGGTSTERDVSVVTSAMVCKSLRKNGHKANIIDVFLGSEKYQNSDAFFCEANDIDELAKTLTDATAKVPDIDLERKTSGMGFFGPAVLDLCKAADIVFIGLHGSNGEDGKIQGMFDLLGIKYTGTGYLSSAISMSKDLTKKVLMTEGIPMPKGITLKKGHTIEYVPFPCVVKPCCGGSSVGVSIANNDEEFKAAVEDAFRYEDEILVEEFVKGREFSVAVIDGKALPVIEIAPISGFYDYKNKYSAGAAKETCPAELPEEIADKMKRWAEKACEVAGIETYARVDELLNEDDEIFCLEINTLPGMTATSLIPQEAQAAGMSYDELTQKIIEISMEKYR
jgi:D-alanine-D-alanine ligase